MEQVPIRVLNQHTASVLARVENGETVEVTNRGKPIARIVPITHSELDDLVEAGWVTPPTLPRPFPMPKVKAPPGSDAGELIRRLRDEERW